MQFMPSLAIADQDVVIYVLSVLSIINASFIFPIRVSSRECNTSYAFLSPTISDQRGTREVICTSVSSAHLVQEEGCKYCS